MDVYLCSVIYWVGRRGRSGVWWGVRSCHGEVLRVVWCCLNNTTVLLTTSSRCVPPALQPQEQHQSQPSHLRHGQQQRRMSSFECQQQRRRRGQQWWRWRSSISPHMSQQACSWQARRDSTAVGSAACCSDSCTGATLRFYWRSCNTQQQHAAAARCKASNNWASLPDSSSTWATADGVCSQEVMHVHVAAEVQGLWCFLWWQQLAWLLFV
jgi:hypothetical protein